MVPPPPLRAAALVGRAAGGEEGTPRGGPPAGRMGLGAGRAAAGDEQESRREIEREMGEGGRRGSKETKKTDMWVPRCGCWYREEI